MRYEVQSFYRSVLCSRKDQSRPRTKRLAASSETLSFRAARHRCAALDASKRSWRVACANAETYIAVAQDGNPCVSPLGDALGPTSTLLNTQTLNAPELRCAAPN
jgi:hypothetical protein